MTDDELRRLLADGRTHPSVGNIFTANDVRLWMAAREAIPRLLAEKGALLDIIAATRRVLDGRPGALAELDRATNEWYRAALEGATAPDAKD